MTDTQPARVHVIVGGYPPGSAAGHDMDYARLRILQWLQEISGLRVTVSGDFTDLDKWLPGCRLLISYVAGPHPVGRQNEFLREWIEAGGRWLALHGTSGGKAAPVDGRRSARQMVKADHHATLGGFFLNHPPLRQFRVHVTNPGHALAKDLPASFEVTDELYLIELQDPASCQVLLTTELATDPSPPGFGFAYEADTALQPDGKTRVLGYTRSLGEGAVAYIALGHCHSSANNVQPFVDASVEPSGNTPRLFRGAWLAPPFEQLLRNGIRWGTERDG